MSARPGRVPAPRKKMTRAELLEAAKANGFNYLSRLECPDLHTLHAEGWLPKDFNPTTGLSKTHRQERCPTCGYWSLWTPKEAP
jgi:hypothetical protein